MRMVRIGLMVGAAALAAWGQTGGNFFERLDENKDGFVTRKELKTAMGRWMAGKAAVTQEEFAKAFGETVPDGVLLGMISPPQNRTPKAEDVSKMMAALPEKAPARPAKPRKLLVLSACQGFVHACIPLAGKTMEEMGAKTGAWTATVTYDAGAITAANLKQYDAVLLNNTTGPFLDDADAAVTAARKKALLEFVRSGKGLAGLHAAGDSYHESSKGQEFAGLLAGGIFTGANKDGDKTLEGEELSALGDGWFERIDKGKAGKVSMDEFRAGFRGVLFSSMGRRGGAPAAGRSGPDTQVGTWPEFNKMIGGFFKWHWNDPATIVYKIDDPGSPLTAMFGGGYTVVDETYTFGREVWSRNNLRVLASVDYSKMSEEDRKKEEYPRDDHDFGLSWVRREGKGRVFYSAHGHSERVYADSKMLAHWLAGVQYALGDLKVDDKPGK